MNHAKHDIEFSVGDIVTFDAYGKPIPAVVKVVDVPPLKFGRYFDERIFYTLSGYGKARLVTTCTGKSIRQSKYFEPYVEEAAKQPFK